MGGLLGWRAVSRRDEVDGPFAEALAWLRWEHEVFGGFGVLRVRSSPGSHGASVLRDEGRSGAAGTEAPSDAPEGERAPVASSPPASDSRMPEMPEPLQRILFGEPEPSRPPAPSPPVRPPEASAIASGPELAPPRGGLPAAERDRRLASLRSEVEVCRACRLHEGRTRTVFARGSAEAEVAFVGEGPGYHEDRRGLPFVGPAGQLLDRMIAAMGYRPEQVYVCNVVKCRPPKNRTPLPEEVVACVPYLEGQLEAVGPRVIVALGRPATEALGCMPPGGRSWRGRWGHWRGIPVMPTYHPAFLLRSPQRKRDVWQDLKAVLARLGRQPPPSGRGRAP